MTTKEIIDSLLKLVELLLSWPVIFLIILLLFRNAISVFLPDLARRISKAEVAGTKFEFSPVAVNALKDAIDQGAEIYKDKPQELVDFVQKQVDKLPTAQSVPQAIPQLSMAGKSILWVDDNPRNNVYEESVLKRLGANIQQAISTDEALSFLHNQRFSLIISDVGRKEGIKNNPNAGYELLEKISSLSDKPPLIFYTSNKAYLDQNRIRSAFGVANSANDLLNLVTRAMGL